MKAELDIFSGRPNPMWPLSPEESAELLRRLRHLPQTEQKSPKVTLGYRGIVVHRSDALGHDIPWIRIQNGTVYILDQSIPQCFHDLAGVETWLLDLARRCGYQNLVPKAKPT